MQAPRHQFIPDVFQSHTAKWTGQGGGLKKSQEVKKMAKNISLMNRYQGRQSFVRLKVQFEVVQRQSWK